MKLTNKLFRCSSLHNIISQSKTKGEVLSVGAKSSIRDMVKEDAFNVRIFTGAKYTSKGLALEDQAIKQAGDKRFKTYKKNTIRANTSIITGEADIIDLDLRIIIDTKCSWDIGTHPFFKDEAREKAVKAGYDIQLHGYFIAFEEYYKSIGIDIKFERGEVDFVLLPTPDELIGKYDDAEAMIDKILAIPMEKRINTVVFERDESIIERIKQIAPHAQRYYKMLKLELIGDDL